MKESLTLASVRYRTLLFVLFLTMACLGFVKPAQAATCSFSNFVVIYSYTANDSVKFKLDATVSSPYPASFTLGYNVVAVPTYYDSGGNVIPSGNTVTCATGGSGSFPYSNTITMSLNPRSNIEANAPYSAVTYTYFYKIHAEVMRTSNQEIVASANDQWPSTGPFNMP